MTRLILVIAFMGLALQSPPSMPPPGNPNHDTPVDGAYCRNFKNDPPAHKCECERQCTVQPDGTVTQVEDNVKCRAACHPQHCHCLSESCDGDHH